MKLTQKEKNLFTELLEAERSYTMDSIELADGLDWSMYQTLRLIDFYSNSRYVNGQIDDLGRVKRFYNVSRFRVNVAIRATDLDIKDFTPEPMDSSEKSKTQAILLKKKIKQWMIENSFGDVVNEAGKVRPKYGGVIMKRTATKVGKKKKLVISVPEWANMIVDPSDIQDGLKIEQHFLTPYELWSKKDVWENVGLAIDSASKERESINGKGTTEGLDERVRVWEVEGYFPNDANPENEDDGDDGEFKLMHFYLAKTGDQLIYLYGEKINESNYLYLPWEKTARRSLGYGVVEDGLESQQAINKAILDQADAMEIGSKIYVKTNAKGVGANMLTDAPSGTVFEMNDGQDMTPVSFTPNTLSEFHNIIEQWDTQFERVSSTFNAVTGETLPSGTPYRQTAILNNEASSLFDYRREEFGMFISDVINKWVLPFVISQSLTDTLISDEFSDDELEYFRKTLSDKAVRDYKIEKVLAGEFPTQEGALDVMDKATKRLQSKRQDVKIPKGYFKDYKKRVYFNPTGEMRNKSMVLETLNNILVTVARAPQILEDNNLRKVFDKILDSTGVISSADFAQVEQTQVQPQAGQMEGVTQTQQ